MTKKNFCRLTSLVTCLAETIVHLLTYLDQVKTTKNEDAKLHAIEERSQCLCLSVCACVLNVELLPREAPPNTFPRPHTLSFRCARKAFSFGAFLA